MLLSWFARRRRSSLLATPFPGEWVGYLERNVSLYTRLNDRDRAKVRDDARVLVAEKNWEGCGGLDMTDEVKVTVAGNAAQLLLGIEHDYFARVMSILVYPSGFRSPDGWRREDGVIDTAAGMLGQAWYDGPVVLAWDEVLAGGRDAKDGRNVVLHEFAHQLDYLDGLADGTPVLRRESDYAKWHDVMTREFERLKAESEHGRPKVLDGYGATNHAEFFAVATEAFFEKSRQMHARHPDLYAVLSEYYGQDPAARTAADTPATPESRPDRKPARRSRVAAKAEVHAAAQREWPWWVRFWDIHPGVSREQALRPLDHHARYVLLGIGLVLFAIGVCYFEKWRSYLKLIPPAVLLLTALMFPVWLRLAVRWVDRHGTWGGAWRPGEAKERPEPPDKAGLPAG